jgi:hypothetical protein
MRSQRCAKATYLPTFREVGREHAVSIAVSASGACFLAPHRLYDCCGMSTWSSDACFAFRMCSAVGCADSTVQSVLCAHASSATELYEVRCLFWVDFSAFAPLPLYMPQLRMR